MPGFFDTIVNRVRALTGAPGEDRAFDDPRSLRNILAELDHLDTTQARKIAAFAFLLHRVAYADQNICAKENAVIETLLRVEGHLSELEAVLVAALAKTQHRLFSGTDNYLAARELRDTLSVGDKHAILRCLFTLAAFDDAITNDENETIRMIAGEMGLERTDYLAARQEYRDKLAALK